MGCASGRKNSLYFPGSGGVLVLLEDADASSEGSCCLLVLLLLYFETFVERVRPVSISFSFFLGCLMFVVSYK